MEEINGFELEGKVLYHRDNIAIAQNPKTIDEHDLIMGKNHLYLGRGILRELAEADKEHFRISMDTLSQQTFSYILTENLLRQNDVMVAFSQARIKELEEEMRNAYHTMSAQRQAL